jgi:hypothetical protein
LKEGEVRHGLMGQLMEEQGEETESERERRQIEDRERGI